MNIRTIIENCKRKKQINKIWKEYDQALDEEKRKDLIANYYLTRAQIYLSREKRNNPLDCYKFRVSFNHIYRERRHDLTEQLGFFYSCLA